MKIYSKLFTLLLTVLFCAGCGKEELYKKNKKETYKGPSVIFTEVNTIFSENGHLKIKLEAPLQIVQQNGDIEYPEGLILHMYNPSGIKTTTMQANKGKFLKDKELYQGTGNVVVTNLEQKQTLYTNELNWNQPKHEIFTQDSVRIVTQNEILRGRGLVSNEDFSKYRIEKPTGIFVIPK